LDQCCKKAQSYFVNEKPFNLHGLNMFFFGALQRLLCAKKVQSVIRYRWIWSIWRNIVLVKVFTYQLLMVFVAMLAQYLNS